MGAKKWCLKAARVDANLTQLEAAEKIGISVQSIRNYEKGIRIPDVHVALKMAEVYGVNVDEIEWGREG